MKRFLLALLFLPLSCFAQSSVVGNSKIVGNGVLTIGGASVPIAGWNWLQDGFNGASVSCSAGPTTCTNDIIATQSGSAGLIVMETGNSGNSLASVSGGGTWTVVPSSQCNFGNATAGSIDCAFNPAITTGTTSIITTAANATSGGLGFYATEFFEIKLPAGASSASVESCAVVSSGCLTSFTSSCTSCTGVPITTTGTDYIIQVNDCAGTPTSLWNDWSGPYYTDILLAGIDTNSAVGSISAPTFSQSAGYCLVAAVAVKSNLGIFTPTTPSPNFVLINYTNQFPSGTTCNPTCALTVPSTTAGNLVVILGSNTGGKTISSASDGTSTWTACAGFNITITSTNDTNSCIYTLSVAGSKTTITPTMSGNATTAFQIYEVSRSTGSHLLDNQNASQRTASAPYFTGQALTLTGSNDVCFQAIFNPGQAQWANLYPQPHGAGILDGQSNGQILLNDASGTAPTWSTNQNFASSVSGICFK